jgi:hypothetical protein
MDAGHEFQSEADGILATTMLKPKDHVLNIRLGGSSTQTLRQIFHILLTCKNNGGRDGGV